MNITSYEWQMRLWNLYMCKCLERHAKDTFQSITEPNYLIFEELINIWAGVIYSFEMDEILIQLNNINPYWRERCNGIYFQQLYLIPYDYQTYSFKQYEGIWKLDTDVFVFLEVPEEGLYIGLEGLTPATYARILTILLEEYSYLEE